MRVLWLLILVAACKGEKPDWSAIDDCAPGISDRTCQISAISTATRQGGLTGLRRGYEDAGTRDIREARSFVFDYVVRFSTDYYDVVAFMTKQIGAPPIRTHDVPLLRFPPTSTVDMWVTSDGTWVANQEDMKLDWYSLPFQGGLHEHNDAFLEAQSERPAPISAAIWRALGRFLIEHPPVEQP